MEKRDIKAILDIVSSGSAAEREQEMAKLWLHQLNQNGDAGHTADELDLISEQMWARLQAGKTGSGKLRRLWTRIAAAASIVLVAGIGYYVLNYSGKVEPVGKTVAYQNDVAPGRDGATLTLSDGRKIMINQAGAGAIASQNGVKVSKTASGELVYELVGGENDPSAYHTLSTARGEQIRVRLPDGSLVFLNSASSLRYPAAFAGSRKVELSGEGYFEVAKDRARPFTVLSRAQQVEVLGTHFNINSYVDEKKVLTTLLEGSVRVNGSTVLKPGEQSALAASGEIGVERVEVEDVVAWKDGKFIFDGESIESIMRKLSRWYDVEVNFEGEVREKRFAGTISRQDNISKILDKITLTRAARFKIEGRRVTVMP